MSSKIRVALDAMGGDNAPREIVKGGIAAVESNNIEVVFVGQEAVIQRTLNKYGPVDNRVSIG